MSQVQDVIRIANSYLGYHEGRDPNGNWNNNNKFAVEMGWANYQAWCASFVCGVFKEAGLIGLIKTPSAGVNELASGFKNSGAFGQVPKLGAIIIIGNGEHTGIVVKFDGSYVWSTEGNTNQNGSPQGDGVYTNKRLRISSRVTGYCYPAYETAPSPQKPVPKPSAHPLQDAVALMVHSAGISYVTVARTAIFMARFPNLGHNSSVGRGIAGITKTQKVTTTDVARTAVFMARERNKPGLRSVRLLAAATALKNNNLAAAAIALKGMS